MNGFIYDIPTKVYFGKNKLEGNLGKELAHYGKKILLVYGGGSIQKSGLYDAVLREVGYTEEELVALRGAGAIG